LIFLPCFFLQFLVTRRTDTTHVIVGPRIKFVAIKGNTLRTDFDFGECRSDLCVKAVFVHAEIKRRIANADKSRYKWQL